MQTRRARIVGKLRGHFARAQPRRGVPLVLVLAWLVGCRSFGTLPFGTPRIEDSSAPRQYVSATRPQARCEPLVELLRSVAQANRPYREVASLSANCYPGVPTECERLLLDRACQLRADAVILMESRSEGTPPGAAKDSRVSRSAIAVRWTSGGGVP